MPHGPAPVGHSRTVGFLFPIEKIFHTAEFMMKPRELDKATKAPLEASAAEPPYRACSPCSASMEPRSTAPCASPALARRIARRRPQALRPRLSAPARDVRRAHPRTYDARMGVYHYRLPAFKVTISGSSTTRSPRPPAVHRRPSTVHRKSLEKLPCCYCGRWTKLCYIFDLSSKYAARSRSIRSMLRSSSWRSKRPLS